MMPRVTGFTVSCCCEASFCLSDVCFCGNPNFKQTTTASALTIREEKKKLNSVNFKSVGYDITKLHNSLDHYRDSVAMLDVNSGVSDQDYMMSILDAYKTQTNEKWQLHVTNLESKIASGDITDSEDLKEKGKAYADTLKGTGEWKAPRQNSSNTTERSGNQSHTTNRGNGNSRSQEGGSGDGDKIRKFKNKHERWKFDKSKGTNGKYDKDGKTYFWCTGPGHHGIPMWVVHKPDDCTNNFSTRGGRGGSSAHTTEREGGGGHNTSQPSRGANRRKKQNFQAEAKKLIQEASGDNGDDFAELVQKLTKAAFDS